MRFKDFEDYRAQRTALLNEAQTALDNSNMEEYNAKVEEVKKMDDDYKTEAEAQANIQALQNAASAPKVITDLYANSALEGAAGDDKEYRMAFMNFIINGTPIKMQNTAAQTTTSEVSAVIPSTVINKIIEKMEVTGKILAKVTRTAYKGGVTIPTSSAKPTASWVAERGTQDSQEKTTSSITFAYRKLICKVAISLETSITTLDVFESTLASNIAEAMVKALETAIVSGTGAGNNQPSGILAETVASGQDVEITEGNHFTYDTIVDVEGALPEAYEKGAEWCMRKKTYFNEVVGMKDTAGQPIARTSVGIDGKPAYNILGRPVVFSDDVPAFATTVSADTKVAFVFNFADYMLNTNMEITTRKYTDEDTDDVVTKAIMLVDGKVVDKNSLVTVTVKNS